MKTTLILMALSLTLSANQSVCDFAKKQYSDNNQRYKFAEERKNTMMQRFYGNQMITNVETIMIECDFSEEKLKVLGGLRKTMVEQLKK